MLHTTLTADYCGSVAARGVASLPARAVAQVTTRPVHKSLGASCCRSRAYQPSRILAHRRRFSVKAESSPGPVAPWQAADARLVLQDGSVWKGKAFGATDTEIGEVVFNTSITGYEEILTDPSYRGQFVVFTHPHIGNVGINLGKPHAIRFCLMPSSLMRNFDVQISILMLAHMLHSPI